MDMVATAWSQLVVCPGSLTVAVVVRSVAGWPLSWVTPVPVVVLSVAVVVAWTSKEARSPVPVSSSALQCGSGGSS